jgi:serine/threonine protein phosphatase PrpC
VETEEIRIALAAGAPDDVCKSLITTANERGGDDNITVVAVERVE